VRQREWEPEIEREREIDIERLREAENREKE
jgi:hypothetical protein